MIQKMWYPNTEIIDVYMYVKKLEDRINRQKVQTIYQTTFIKESQKTMSGF